MTVGVSDVERRAGIEQIGGQHVCGEMLLAFLAHQGRVGQHPFIVHDRSQREGTRDLDVQLPTQDRVLEDPPRGRAVGRDDSRARAQVGIDVRLVEAEPLRWLERHRQIRLPEVGEEGSHLLGRMVVDLGSLAIRGRERQPLEPRGV